MHLVLGLGLLYLHPTFEPNSFDTFLFLRTQGVMLCSMPPVGSSRKETFAKPTSTAAPLAPRVDRFVTGRVHAKVGYIQKPSSGGEQAAAEAARVRTERKIYNVLSKHKRWLAELKRKKQKQADEENQVDDEVHYPPNTILKALTLTLNLLLL